MPGTISLELSSQHENAKKNNTIYCIDHRLLIFNLCTLKSSHFYCFYSYYIGGFGDESCVLWRVITEAVITQACNRVIRLTDVAGLQSVSFAHLRASAASIPPWMAVVLHSSDVFVIAKTRHQQMYTDVYLLMRYLLLIFAKASFSITSAFDSFFFIGIDYESTINTPSAQYNIKPSGEYP